MRVSTGFIYADWTDKVRPLNDAKTVEIDPTKYFIKTFAHHNSGRDYIAEHSAHVNQCSASFAALDSAHLDEHVSARLHCAVADSAPNISVSYDGPAHSRRRGPAHATRATPIVADKPVSMSDLNLTHSMTSLIQSGSTSSHAWPTLSSPASAQAAAGKPPSNKHRVRPPTKRSTPRVQSDDNLQTPPPAFGNRPLQRPVSVDALSRSDATPRKAPAPLIVDIKRQQLRPASSCVLTPQNGGTTTQRSPATPVIRSPPANALLRQQPCSATVTQTRVRRGSFSPPGGAEPWLKGNLMSSPFPPVTTSAAAASGQRSAFQERRQRCVSQCDVRLMSPTSPATGGTGRDCQRHSAARTDIRPRPRLGVNLIARNPRQTAVGHGKTASLIDVNFDRRTSSSSESGSVVGAPGAVRSPRDVTKMAADDTSSWGANPVRRNPPQTGRGKAVSLVDVTSADRISNSVESRYVVGAPASARSPRDVTNMAEKALGGKAGSHDSLSDEGYQTKDSGSTTSLNRAQSSFRGLPGHRPMLSAYL